MHASPGRWCAAAALLLVLPAPARSQALEARTRAFFEAVRADSRERVAEFFPRRGGWSWVQTLRMESTPTVIRVSTWRFPAAETRRAIGQGGPFCNSIDQGSGHSGPFEESFGMQVRIHDEEDWRRVRGSRFVPPGESARSPIFVEWRREGGAWVVSSIGDQTVSAAVAARRPRPGMIQRSTHPVPNEMYAPETEWFDSYHPIVFEEDRYIKYGLPREIDIALLSRIGHRDRVPVYVEKGYEAAPEVIYVLTGPSTFQPYEGRRSPPCQ